MNFPLNKYFHALVRFTVVFSALYSCGSTLSSAVTETHPFILYTTDEYDAIPGKMIREPYASWSARLLSTADGILAAGVAWNSTVVPKVTQSYYTKILAAAFVFSDTIAVHRHDYGAEAARALYNMPRAGFTSYFSSDLDISEAVMDWAEAYDMLKGAGFDFTAAGVANMESTIRGSFTAFRDYMARDWNEDFLFSSSIQRDFPSAAFVDKEHTDNHHVKLYSSLTVLSLAIYGESGSEADFSRARSRLLNVLDTMTITGDNGEPAGGWAEGPEYHRYSARQYLPAIQAMMNLNILDYTDLPELEQTHRMLPNLVMPDGYMPPIDDNEAIVFYPAGLLYSRKSRDPEDDMLLWMWNLTGGTIATELLPDYLAAFDDTPPVYKNPAELGWNPTGFFPESGFARFRSSWDSDALYLLLLSEHGEARINGQAHEHPDPNTIVVHAFGELLLLDSGYGGFGSNEGTRNAASHNLILVDGDGPDAASQASEGSLFNFWNANGADSYLSEYFTSPDMDCARTTTRYRDTDFIRTVLFPGHRYFLVYDTVVSDRTRIYTLLLHGNGGGTSGGSFTPVDSGAIWKRGIAALRSFTTCSSVPTVETVDMSHAVYNRTPMLSHTVLKVSQSGIDERFLTILYPERAGGTMPGLSAADVSSGRGIRISRSDTTDYACMTAGGSSFSLDTATRTYTCDGDLVHISETGATLDRYFLLNGTFLTSGADTLFFASQPVTAQMNLRAANGIEGYIRATGETVIILNGVTPSAVTFCGEKITFATYRTSVSFSVSGEGALTIAPLDVIYTLEPPSDVTVSDAGNDNGHQIRITWTLSHSEGDGAVDRYRIYRSRTHWLTESRPKTDFTTAETLAAWEAGHTVLVDSVLAGTTDYIDASVPHNSVTYYYWLQAVGPRSASSKEIARQHEPVTVIDEKPDGFILQQPKPNPFNASTTIGYYLPADMPVTITVYDILGRRIAVIGEGFMSAGWHTASWNGYIDSGSRAGSGVYLLRFASPSFSQLRKVVLLK